MSVEALPRKREQKVNVNRPTSEVFEREKTIRHRPRSQNIEPSTNVFVNYIPPEFTENDLRNLCSNYGDIVCSKIMINLETGQSKCFGFVRFAGLQEAQAAIRGINGMTIGNKRLLAKYAESHEKKERVSTMLYIKRLPLSVKENDVIRVFSPFGEILQITPHTLDSVDPHYWRCFLQFVNQDSATKAMAMMNNQIIAPNTRPIHVRYADEQRLSGTFMVPTGFSEQDELHLLPSFLFN